MSQRREAALALDAREVFDVAALDREPHAAAGHRDQQRLGKRVDALDGQIAAVVNRGRVATGGRASHGQQAHGRHALHLEDHAAEVLVHLRAEVGASVRLHQLVQERHGTIDRLDPRLTTALVVVEPGVLVEELELLDRRGEVPVSLGEGVAHLLRDRPFLTLLGVLGAIQDVCLGGLELAGRLQRQLDRILDDLDRRLAWPRGHDVDHAQRQLGNGRIRLPAEGRETAREGVFDAHRVEGDDPPVAFDDVGRQGDFFDGCAVDHAHAALGEPKI